MIKALIFDMDGVLIDSEVHWKKAELAFFQQWIPHWSKKDQGKLLGMNIADTHQLLTKEYGFKLPQKDFLKAINVIADEIYAKKTKLLDGCMDLIQSLKGIVLMGMASSALRRWIKPVSKRFRLDTLFDAIVSSEDVKGPGKPAP
ncbi:MAG: HAD family phosphatase, partial [Candidatus Peregrinibacteria bacterium]